MGLQCLIRGIVIAVVLTQVIAQPLEPSGRQDSPNPPTNPAAANRTEPVAEVPTTSVPITSAPTTASLNTAAADTAAPDTATPDAAAPNTSVPVDAASNTAAPNSAAPDTAAPETAAQTTEGLATAGPDTASPVVQSTAAPDAVTPTEAAPGTTAPDTAAPDSAVPSTDAATSTLGPDTASPSTAVPIAVPDTANTAAPSTVASDTTAPNTASVDTAAPRTTAADTAAPSTVAADTVAPGTAAPNTIAPDTIAPSAAAPTEVAPSTAASDTAAPSTAVPDTASPDTTTPSTAAPDPAGPTTAVLNTGTPTTTLSNTAAGDDAAAQNDGLPAGTNADGGETLTNEGETLARTDVITGGDGATEFDLSVAEDVVAGNSGVMPPGLNKQDGKPRVAFGNDMKIMPKRGRFNNGAKTKKMQSRGNPKRTGIKNRDNVPDLETLIRNAEALGFGEAGAESPGVDPIGVIADVAETVVSSEGACPLVACDLLCNHGKILDNNGCELCECKFSPDCPPVVRASRLLCMMQVQVSSVSCERDSQCPFRRTCCPGLCGPTCRRLAQSSRTLSLN